MVEGPRAIAFGERTLLMGVVNVTPDSFSDGGDFATTGAAIDHALRLESEGADLVDIGGQSTRPGSKDVSLAEESRRVVPVFEGLRGRARAHLSVDTSKAAVARACLEAGASVVNDVTAARAEPPILDEVARAGGYVVLMHMQGAPRTMQEKPTYKDVVAEVVEFLEARASTARERGIPRDRIIVDPGIGFGKTLEHNLALLSAVPRIKALGYPVCVGVSRKSLFKGLLGIDQPKARDEATAHFTALLAAAGADIVRVHEVPRNRAAATIGQRVRRAGGGLPPAA